MAFPIELLVTERDLVPILKSAIEPLNRVQTEFRFEIANERLLQDSIYFKADTYSTENVFIWLRSFRTNTGGNRPFIILVTRAYLKGVRYENIFGTHKGTEGLAVFTTDQFHKRFKNQFLFDQIRYCQYYLVRYSLSFVAPAIKNHETKGCMFDLKDYRPDIRLSLETGKICPDCEKSLKDAQLCNLDVFNALNEMLGVVSNRRPRALVMKGGGVKGLALVGSMQEIEKHFTFDTFSGTSAGAIAAILLGAGYTPAELENIFRKKPFKEFLDRPWKIPCNLLRNWSLFSGDPIEAWIGELLSQRIIQESRIKMKDMVNRTVIYASRRVDGPLVYDSADENKDEIASFAVRCSMSIPIFFRPKLTGGIRTYDGGLGLNFPLRKFIEENEKDLFIGLYLKSKPKQRGNIIGDLIDIATDADERTVVDKNRDKVVIIDPWPIGTTQFTLTKVEKDFLILSGKVGALKYLVQYHKDIPINLSDLEKLENELDLERNKVLKVKRRRKYKRIVIAFIVLLLLSVIYYFRGFLFSWA